VFRSVFFQGREADFDTGVHSGSKDEIELSHSYNEGQIEWFKAGSALNKMAEDKLKKSSA
jgi:aconitate hydratase